MKNRKRPNGQAILDNAERASRAAEILHDTVTPALEAFRKRLREEGLEDIDWKDDWSDLPEYA